MRVMIRMFTATYGESVSCTPMLEMRRPERAHRERDDIQPAPGHRAPEQLGELALHLGGVAPVVGGPGVAFVLRADEGAILDPRHVVGIRAGQVAAGPLRLVQADERARGHELAAQLVVLLG